MKRILVPLLLVVVVPSMVTAQNMQSLGSARGHQVAVIDADSREWQGRLLEIAKDVIVVEVQSTPRTFELVAVKRVDAHGDRIVDGAIKGALFGALIGMVVLGPRHALPAATTYGLIGLGLDALNNCHHTVYRAPATQAAVKVSW